MSDPVQRSKTAKLQARGTLVELGASRTVTRIAHRAPGLHAPSGWTSTPVIGPAWPGASAGTGRGVGVGEEEGRDEGAGRRATGGGLARREGRGADPCVHLTTRTPASTSAASPATIAYRAGRKPRGRRAGSRAGAPSVAGEGTAAGAGSGGGQGRALPGPGSSRRTRAPSSAAAATREPSRQSAALCRTEPRAASSSGAPAARPRA